MMDTHQAEIIVQHHESLRKRIEAVQYVKDPELLELLAVSDESQTIQEKALERIRELAPKSRKANKIFERFCRHLKLRFRMDNAENIQEFMETSRAKKIDFMEFYYPDAPKNLKIYKVLRNFCEGSELRETIHYIAFRTDNSRYKDVRINHYKTIWVEEFEWLVLVKALHTRYDGKLDYKYSLIKFWKGHANSDKKFTDWSWMRMD